MSNDPWEIRLDRLNDADPVLSRGPERLVGLGFRYWMLGQQTGDIQCWADAWNVYKQTLGCAGARLAVSHLSSWVKALDRAASRDIAVNADANCCGFCRDEKLAIAMVAACQHDTCPAMRACAFALIESVMLDEVVHETECFGSVMRTLGQILSPVSLTTPTAPCRILKPRQLH